MNIIITGKWNSWHLFTRFKVILSNAYSVWSLNWFRLSEVDQFDLGIYRRNVFAFLVDFVSTRWIMVMTTRFFTCLYHWNPLPFDPESYVAWFRGVQSTNNPDVIWTHNLSINLIVAVYRWKTQFMLWVRVNPAVLFKIVLDNFNWIFIVIGYLTRLIVSFLFWDEERADNLYTPNSCSCENPTRLNIPHCI